MVNVFFVFQFLSDFKNVYFVHGTRRICVALCFEYMYSSTASALLEAMPLILVTNLHTMPQELKSADGVQSVHGDSTRDSSAML